MSHLSRNVEHRRFAELLLSFALAHLSYDAPVPASRDGQSSSSGIRRRFGGVVKIDHTQCSTLTRRSKRLERILPSSPPPLNAMLGSDDKTWFEVYKTAGLELDHRKIPERIVAAKVAVQLRRQEIQGDTDHHAERRQIEDTFRTSRTLKRKK